MSTTEAFLITDAINIRYLTGFVGVAPEEREAYVLQTTNQLYVFTNALYIEQAKKLPNVNVVEISREDPLSKKLKELIHTLGIARLFFEEINLSYAEYRKLKSELPEIELVGTQGKIELLREIKNTDEIEHIVKAAKITDMCFEYILGKLKPGVTEQEIAWEIESFFRKNNATDAFSPIVAFGKNSSMPHYQQENNDSLTNNQIILLDFGARFNGYCSDMTRTIFFGKPKDEWKNAYNAVLSANERAIKLLTDGVQSGSKLDQAARNELITQNLPAYPHSLGHGVGLAIHESPRLSYKSDAKLKDGMTITIEPGVYIEDAYGIRIEDLVLLKDNSIIVLSHSPKAITIL